MMNLLFLLTFCFAVLTSTFAKPAPLLTRGQLFPRSGLHDCGVFIQRVSLPPRSPHHLYLTLTYLVRSVFSTLSSVSTDPFTVVGFLLRHLHLQQLRHIQCLLRLGLHPHRRIRSPQTPRTTSHDPNGIQPTHHNRRCESNGQQ